MKRNSQSLRDAFAECTLTECRQPRAVTEITAGFNVLWHGNESDKRVEISVPNALSGSQIAGTILDGPRL